MKRVKVEAVEEGPLCLVCGWFGHDRHHCCTHPNDYNHERRDTRFKLNEAELLMHIQSFEKWNLNDLRDNRYNHNNPLNLMDMSDVLCRACGLFGHDEDYCFTPPCYYSEKARGPPIPRARRLLNWRFYGLPKFTVGNNNTDNNNNNNTTTTTTNNNNNTDGWRSPLLCPACGLLGHVKERCFIDKDNWNPEHSSRDPRSALSDSQRLRHWRMYGGRTQSDDSLYWHIYGRINYAEFIEDCIPPETEKGNSSPAIVVHVHHHYYKRRWDSHSYPGAEDDEEW